MKRVALLKHLRSHGCVLEREGSEHSIWKNPTNDRQTTIPRHREIKEVLARIICKQLDVPKP